MDQARETLTWAATFAQRPNVATWIKAVRQARQPELDGDTQSRRASDASSDTSDAHVEWERARAAAILEGRMSFDDERRAVWSEAPSYPFASRDGSTIRSSYTTAITSTAHASNFPRGNNPLDWHSPTSSTSTIRPTHTKMKTPDSKPDAWFTSTASLPTKPSSARLRSSSTDSEWTLTPSEFAHRPSWLQSGQSRPDIHRTDAPPITRLYAGPSAQTRDHLAMGNRSIEWMPKSTMVEVQRPVEAHHPPGQRGSVERCDAEVLYAQQGNTRLQEIPLRVKALRQRELESDCEQESLQTTEGKSDMPSEPKPVLLKSLRWTETSVFGGAGTMGQRNKDLEDLEKAADETLRAQEKVNGRSRLKSVMVGRKFWLGVMALLLLVFLCVCIPLAFTLRGRP